MASAAIAYICRNCGETNNGRYHPFCAHCGSQQPPHDEMHSLGLAKYHATHDKEYTADPKKMNHFLARHFGKEMALWSYSVSHSSLELRLRHSGAPGDSHEPWLNTVIYCTPTTTIQIPQLRWRCGLQVDEIAEGNDTFYLLYDQSAGVRIGCYGVSMYFDVEHGL